MGSCFSKKKTPTPPPTVEENPAQEEETVKEVLCLSETAKPSFPRKIELIGKEPPPPPPPLIVDEKAPPTHSCDDPSEISEYYCSLSESLSTTTITTTEKKGDEVEMRPKEKRSPAKFNNRKRSISISGSRRSPARRLDPSPAKRMEVGQTSTRYRNPPPTTTSSSSNESRRDPGENSGWRSRSPATRRRNDLSRISSKDGRPAKLAEDVGSKYQETTVGNESLENPLVSLECFIFL
ncbi:uncharacterized protein LOC143846544 [Tasmannia lanceolata]|uniref:uncharacterized protein LOC143846544 n=1 Tax=Tasmannia lanceolata TaxID=3420 RepID=UPI00406336ED